MVLYIDRMVLYIDRLFFYIDRLFLYIDRLFLYINRLSLYIDIWSGLLCLTSLGGKSVYNYTPAVYWTNGIVHYRTQNIIPQINAV